jgi:hypothetical protein
MTDPEQPRPSRSASQPAGLEVAPRRWVRWLWVPAGLVLVGLAVWWMRHPAELGKGDEVGAVTKVGRTVYVGASVLGSEADSRQISVRDVRVRTAGETDGARLDVLVCHGGAIGVTATLEPFCDSVEDAKGATVSLPADQLVVAVTAETAQQVTVEEIEVSYRQGLQWGTQPAGPRIVVDVRG